MGIKPRTYSYPVVSVGFKTNMFINHKVHRIAGRIVRTVLWKWSHAFNIGLAWNKIAEELKRKILVSDIFVEQPEFIRSPLWLKFPQIFPTHLRPEWRRKTSQTWVKQNITFYLDLWLDTKVRCATKQKITWVDGKCFFSLIPELRRVRTVSQKAQ